MSKSRYGDRDTVGKIYRDAQIANTEPYIETGDLAREFTTSLVEDINEAIKNFDKREKPYFLMVEEKRDLQMPNAIARRIHYFGYRPWPEDNTTVFWKNPKTQELRFCWCLPHHSEMPNILAMADQYDKSFIEDIRAWEAFDMHHFGFFHHQDLKWIPIPNYKDRKMEPNPAVSSNILSSVA